MEPGLRELTIMLFDNNPKHFNYYVCEIREMGHDEFMQGFLQCKTLVCFSAELVVMNFVTDVPATMHACRS